MSDTLHTLKVSELGTDCDVARRVVTTSAASYSTPISRIEVHFSGSSERVTQTITS